MSNTSIDKDLLKNSLTLKEIEEIVVELGSSEPITNKQGQLQFKTICHGGDSHKLYYYDNTKMFCCYTGCQETFDIYTLIQKVKKLHGEHISFYESVKYVANRTNKEHLRVNPNTSLKTDDWEWLAKFKRKKVNPEIKIYDEKVLETFLPYPHESWLEEGISYETLVKFEVGYYIRDERITIPHRNIDGKLIGIRGRATRQEDIDNGKKYIPLTIGNTLYTFPTMMNLYGIHITKNAIKRYGKIGLFEGEKSVFKAHDFYGDDNWTVALGGSNVSKFQLKMMLDLGVKEVFLFPDKEFEKIETKRDEIFAKQILKHAHMLAPYFKVYLCWDKWGLLDIKDSPIDKGKEVFEYLLKNKIEIGSMEKVLKGVD